MYELCWHSLSVCKHCANKFFRTDEAAGEWAPQSADFLSSQDKNSETPQLLPTPQSLPSVPLRPLSRCLVSFWPPRQPTPDSEGSL